MKKLFISIIVIGMFGIYSFHQKQEAAEMPVVAPQKQIASADTPTPTPGATEANQVSPLPTAAASNGSFKDGQYTGSVADAFYGNIQVKVIVQGGRLTDVQFLQYPNDRQESIMINEQAMPYLKSEAIQAQSSQVDVVSGATDTSLAFVESLGSALSQAK